MRIRADQEIRTRVREQVLILRGMGVRKIDVGYSGSGDEGYVNDVIFTPELPKGSGFDKGRLMDLLYDYLDPAHVGDWVNNEGGFGEISISMITGRVKGSVSFYETTVSSESKLTDQL
jgi:hypothetical protein